MGTQLLPKKGTAPTQFLAHVYCSQMEINLGPGDVVLDEVTTVPPKRGTAPQFSIHVYCDTTAGWMKTLLGTEVDLGPSHIVLDGDPAPP